MKRYDHNVNIEWGNVHSYMNEDKDGDYVKYEDIKNLHKWDDTQTVINAQKKIEQLQTDLVKANSTIQILKVELAHLKAKDSKLNFKG